MRSPGQKLPFSYLMMAILFVTIVIIVLAGIWINYQNSKHTIEENAERLRVMTESHLDNSFRLIDTGLKLYDNTYNEQVEDAFVLVMAEYNRTAGDPASMDLDALKTRIGGMDVYVINDRCVIEYATVPGDIGLDFSVIYPDFCLYLHEIQNTSGFYPDRVVMEWFTGTLTKYSYMPTPDHRYIIEIGLRSDRFAQERMDLQYSDVVDEVNKFNPYLDEVLLFQKQKRLLYNTSYVPTTEDSEMLDYLLWENRTTQVVRQDEPDRTIVWKVIDLRDPDYAADMSIFGKLIYNNDLLNNELDRLALMHAFAAVLVIFSGALIALLVSRKISGPIEQLVRDVDTIASGDLDHPIRPVSGYEVSSLAGSIQVMVDRLKEQIQECRINEKRFTDLVQLLPQGIFEADIAGNITYANRAAVSLFGYVQEDLKKGLNILDMLSPGDAVRAKETYMAVMQGERTEGSEYTGVRKDGSTCPIMVYNTARIVDGGTVLGSRGSIIDITRLKDIEMEIRRLNAELEHRVSQRTAELKQINDELEAFTYSVSHDLRAPLRSLDGYSFILKQSVGARLDENEQHYIDVVRHNVGIMENLIDGLLTLSRIGRQELTREWTDPGPLVNEVVSELLEQVPERRIAVSIGELPPCFADPSMLRQVYANLIGNAIKFTRHTSDPSIEIGAVTSSTGTVYHVRDNGIGFDMEYADRIFKPFQRLHSTKDYDGSGIGLATVERIIRRHGGSVWAEGKPGEGATIYFTIGGPP